MNDVMLWVYAEKIW